MRKATVSLGRAHRISAIMELCRWSRPCRSKAKGIAMSQADGKLPWEKTAVAVLATLLVVVVAVNFKKPEKRLAHLVDHLNGIDDPIFQREMGVLLGPGILDGNSITPLQNGDEI